MQILSELYGILVALAIEGRSFLRANGKQKVLFQDIYLVSTFLREDRFMNSSMNKKFLKSIYCILAIIVFQIYVISMSFAGVLNKNTGVYLLQKGNDADHKINNDEDEDEDGEEEDDDDDGEDEDSHNAGRNCLTSGCHTGGREHTFSIGGTIYDDAEGSNARKSAKIKITDANGQKVRLRSDQLGNFYSEKDLTAPFTISVSYRGRTVSMPTGAENGGCNADGCHTTEAEGRVFINTNDLDLAGMVTSNDNGGNSSEISYESSVKSILDAKCISCHKEGGSESSIPLTTYAEVTDPRLVTPGSEDSLLLRKLDKNSSEGTMWPNLNSNSEYNTIKDWIVEYNAREYLSDTIDVAGEPVAGAKVRLSKNGKIKYQTKTDEGGEFILEKVKAGAYSMKVYKKGYDAYNQSYQMNQTDVTPLEITLKKK
ncbi:MAG: carboxypeptidase regulatory-like domain-containing protein [Candidatus Kuenenia stuttgartiensis]|nr:carboxypeptidase regulatory-like domain-containing protein [Candidatus Kuenenia stuttgartiensis]